LRPTLLGRLRRVKSRPKNCTQNYRMKQYQNTHYSIHTDRTIQSNNLILNNSSVIYACISVIGMYNMQANFRPQFELKIEDHVFHRHRQFMAQVQEMSSKWLFNSVCTATNTLRLMAKTTVVCLIMVPPSSPC